MNRKEIQDITLQYYSQFCGVDLAEVKSGLYFVCSAARDQMLKGYGCKYSLFLLRRDSLTVAAYSPKHKEFMESLKGRGAEEILAAAEQNFQLKHRSLFLFRGETVTDYGSARILEPADYSLYETFFRAVNPEADPEGWLREYFTEKAEKGYMTGCVRDGRLVSVCDVPDMPYLEGKIQHTGIQTLPEEKRKGYARCAAGLATHHLIESGICPQWECNADNDASIGLAKSLGYEMFGLAHILEEQ